MMIEEQQVYYVQAGNEPQFRSRGVIHAILFLCSIIYISPILNVVKTNTQFYSTIAFFMTNTMCFCVSAMYNIIHHQSVQSKQLMEWVQVLLIFPTCGCMFLPAIIEIDAFLASLCVVITGIIMILYSVVLINHSSRVVNALIAISFIICTAISAPLIARNTTQTGRVFLYFEIGCYTISGIIFASKWPNLCTFVDYYELFHLFTVFGFICAYFVNYITIRALKV